MKKGNLLLAHKISLSNFSNYPHSKSIHRLKHIKSLLQALELDWYPVLNSSNNRKFEPTEGKILHLHKVSYPFESTGGAIRNLNIVKSQKELGLEPIVVTPLNYPRIFGKISFKLDEAISEVRHIRLDLGSTNSLNLQYLSQNLQTNTLMLASIIQKEKPELIHAASGYKGYELAVMAKTLSDHFGIPWIYEVRSFHEHTWTKEPEYCMNSERTNMRMKRENSLMQAAAHVVTISESMKKAIIERGVDASKITIIPNAVDLNKFKPVKKNSSLIDKYALNGNILLGYISNISYREGHDILIRAMKSIILTNPKVRLMLVGTGAEIESMKLLSKELGLENYVIFTGNVDHSEITQYYSIIDLFIVPRRQDYASDLVTPLKPFEAMAMKIPLLVSDRPALIEIIGNNRGESFITEDVENLSTTVIDCLNNNEKLTANVEEAFAWVTTSRTWESNALKYKSLYEGLLRRN
jgi:glycosyltransferase involved in cell wall biosynthesis